jgi:hypothetical protein
LQPENELASMKCVKCNAELAPGERFCGDCGAPVESIRPSPAPSPIYSSKAPTVHSPQVPKPRPTSVLRILLGILLVVSVLIGFVALLCQIVILHQGYWAHSTASSIATTFMVGACFLFGCSLAILFPRLYLAYLFLSVVWVVVALLTLLDLFGSGWGFWPDWMFATGLATLIGGVIGFVIAMVAKSLRKN